jgi:hypothetical protein
LDLCLGAVVVVLVVGVVVVGVVLDAGAAEVVPPEEPPHPATATVLARAMTDVRMAFSGAFLMGRVPIVVSGLGISP